MVCQLALEAPGEQGGLPVLAAQVLGGAQKPAERGAGGGGQERHVSHAGGLDGRFQGNDRDAIGDGEREPGSACPCGGCLTGHVQARVQESKAGRPPSWTPSGTLLVATRARKPMLPPDGRKPAWR
jgi:hypothetical protein